MLMLTTKLSLLLEVDKNTLVFSAVLAQANLKNTNRRGTMLDTSHLGLSRNEIKTITNENLLL